MVENPKYEVGDNVSFRLGKEIINGVITLVHKFSKDVAYDIKNDNVNVFYTYVKENAII